MHWRGFCNFVARMKGGLTGLILSLLCTVHCMALPAIIAAGYSVQGSVITNPIFEWLLLGSTLITGYFTVLKSYLAHKDDLKPVILWALGILLILSEQFNFSPVPFLPVFGGILLAVSFWLNHKLAHKHGQAH